MKETRALLPLQIPSVFPSARRLLKLSLIYTFPLVMATGLHGATFTSVNSGDWSSPCTWGNYPGCPSKPPAAVIGVNVPGPYDDVIIANKDAINVTTDVTIRNLMIDNGNGKSTTTRRGHVPVR